MHLRMLRCRDPLARVSQSSWDGIMKDYQPRMSFCHVAAARRHQYRGDETEAVEYLALAAGGGPVLELGIGAGRLAIPLAQRGLEVDGVDFAPEMIALLRQKAGVDTIRVVLGDFASADYPRESYAMVFVVWNSLFNLLTQDDQIACFRNVARHLAPDGCYVVEAYAPTYLHRLDGQQAVKVEDLSVDEVRISVIRHDPASQIVEQSHVSLTEQGTRFNPVVQRYAWPSELDLMARIAGLKLRERWSDWKRHPFDAASHGHVSVYVR